MKTKRPFKLLPVWLAVSAVVIIAGIILMALLGFNTSPERQTSYTVDLRYDVSVANVPESAEALKKACDDAFAQNGLTVADRQEGEDLYNLHMTVITYVFGSSADPAALEAAQTGIRQFATANFADADIRVEYHVVENNAGLDYEQMWRGAVALTVGVVVGLIYIGIRFGVGCAVTGLCVAAHDAVFTASLFAIARIPTYAYAPLLFAAIAAVVSLAFWLLHCMKLRDVKKDPVLRNLDAAEAVAYAWEANWKKLLILAAAGVAAFAVSGAIAVAGVRLFLFPCVIPIAVALYSSLLLGPSLHVFVKGLADRFSAKHKPRYFGKKKEEKAADREI